MPDPNHQDEELAQLRGDIEKRSGEGQSQSAEQLTEAAQALHNLKQQQADIEFADPAEKFNQGSIGDIRTDDEGMKAEFGYMDPPGRVNPHAMKMVMEAEKTGEPLFCFRARDFFSVQVISHYAEIVEKYGPDDSAFHNNIVDALGDFKEWQKANVSKVRYPD